VINVGPMEIVVILVIALVVLGPARLPEMARSAGRGMREFRNALSGSGEDDGDGAPRGA
jgi:sec-independent protein translocase protein TatA